MANPLNWWLRLMVNGHPHMSKTRGRGDTVNEWWMCPLQQGFRACANGGSGEKGGKRTSSSCSATRISNINKKENSQGYLYLYSLVRRILAMYDCRIRYCDIIPPTDTSIVEYVVVRGIKEAAHQQQR
mmetsp:Transcript_30537/g.56033  ORF Transcript_30537/g.56033 Transcript_30537/m.56033 type:complete len:128 (+) Transcript_30537:687-1070(+)